MTRKSTSVIGAALLAAIAVSAFATDASARAGVRNFRVSRALALGIYRHPGVLTSYNRGAILRRILAGRGGAVSLNPQPLPPSPCLSCPGVRINVPQFVIR